ncbi:heterokaryon incompatibility protein Het-C-domain-containing protein [Abortiporus biennis]|nr:heterokaryon incompatibility protein Het-C-domain-containing protein [Abortiporus biennis]
MAFSATQFLLIVTAILVIMPSEAYCFGAGQIPNDIGLHNIAFRHGDLEEVLKELTKWVVAGAAVKFTSDDYQRVYFGNWLRDYSQLMDVTGLKLADGSRETLLLVVQVLSYVTFGYATKEFLVTEDRLGVYQHVQHIDNPFEYGIEENPKTIHSQLRSPCHSGAEELNIDPKTAMKNYIAREGECYDTSATYVRNTLKECIREARRAGLQDNEHMHESYRLLGSALHTLEDLSAHSNWVELALRKMGYDQVFCHVGDKAPNGQMVPPLVTGTFGSIDMIQSILGECQDHMASASLNDFRKKSANVRNKKRSFAQFLLKMMMKDIPKDSAAGNSAAKVEDLQKAGENIQQKVYSDKAASSKDILGYVWDVLEWFEEAMRNLKKTLEELGIVKPETIEKIQGWFKNIAWALIAVVVEPIFNEIAEHAMAQSNTMKEGSHSQNQAIFAADSDGHNPTHTDLAKDHFDNALNEIAGKVAKVVVKETVDRVTEAWKTDDEKEWDCLLNEILEAFHHPYFSTGNSAVQNGQDGSSILAGVTRDTLDSFDQFFGMLWDAGEDAIDAVKKTVGEIDQFATKVGDEIDGALTEAGKAVEQGVEVIGNAVDETIRDIGDGAIAVVSTADELINQAGKDLDDFAGTVSRGAEELADDAVRTAGDAVDTVGEVFQDAGNQVGGFVSGVADDVGTFFGSLW